MLSLSRLTEIGLILDVMPKYCVLISFYCHQIEQCQNREIFKQREPLNERFCRSLVLHLVKSCIMFRRFEFHGSERCWTFCLVSNLPTLHVIVTLRETKCKTVVKHENMTLHRYYWMFVNQL